MKSLGLGLFSLFLLVGSASFGMPIINEDPILAALLARVDLGQNPIINEDIYASVRGDKGLITAEEAPIINEQRFKFQVNYLVSELTELRQRLIDAHFDTADATRVVVFFKKLISAIQIDQYDEEIASEIRTISSLVTELNIGLVMQIQGVTASTTDADSIFEEDRAKVAQEGMKIIQDILSMAPCQLIFAHL